MGRIGSGDNNLTVGDVNNDLDKMYFYIILDQKEQLKKVLKIFFNLYY